MRFLTLLALIFISLNADHVSWYGDFDKAHKQALKENKKLMVLLIKKDCPPCKESLKKAFINQTYIEKINSEFISVIVIKDQKNSYPIEMLYTFIYPSLFFLDKNELFICESIRGEVTPDKLERYLEKCK